jgi:hypothetical protein
MVVLLGFIMLCIAVATGAAGEGKEEMKGMKGEMMGGKGMKCGGGMMKMCPMHEMMESMAEPEIVATRDGGVVVMLGGRLYKYDRNLKLKSETELKIGMEMMHGMMMRKMGKCPMMERMGMEMGEGMMMGKCPMMERMGMEMGEGMMEKCPMMKKMMKKAMMGKKTEEPAAEPETPEKSGEHETHH